MWRSEGNSKELVLAYSVGSRDRTQVVMSSSRCQSLCSQ